MWRHKTHTAINLVGLTSAFVVVFFIVMLVKDELSWDRHHSKAERTYRVVAKYNTDGGSIGWAIGEYKRAPLMKTDFPDFETVARLGVVAPPVRYKDKVFQEDRFFIADPEAAVRAFKWMTAVGKRFKTNTLDENTAWQPKKGRIIGVVKDFHYAPMQKKIVPVVFFEPQRQTL